MMINATASYWKDHYDDNAARFKTSPLRQVGKTSNGIEIDRQELGSIIRTIADVLELSHRDVVTDLCCGNGLLTKDIALSVKRVIGVDFSRGLLEYARAENNAGNIAYIESDVLQLPWEFFEQASKHYMYEALQHFSGEMLTQLLANVSRSGKDFKFFIGSVPDRSRLWDYYDTLDKKQFYLKTESEGKPHLGTWWEKDQIQAIAGSFGLKVYFLDQPRALYTSYYRYDVLIRK